MATSALRSQHPGISNAFVTISTFLVLAFLLPAFLVHWEMAEVGNVAVWAAYCVVLYCSLRLALVLGRGRPEYLHGGFWIFAYVFMGVALLAQIAADRYPEQGTYSENVLVLSSFVILLGFLAYDVGRKLAGKAKSSSVGPRGATLTISLTTTLLVAVFGLLFVGIAINRIGVDPFFSSRNAVDEALQGRRPGITERLIKSEDKAAGQLFQNAVRVPVFVALYILLIAGKAGAHRKWGAANRLAIFVFAGVLLLANLVVNNPIGSSRFWMGLLAIGFGSVFLNPKRKHVFRISIVAFLTVFLFSFSALDAFRRTAVREYGLGASVPELLLSHLDYGMTKVTHETMVYVAENGHTVGRQMLGVVGLWIPRRIWSDKPIPTGALVNRGFVNVASPLWAEGYIDFGFLGVVLLLGFYGWGSRRLDEIFLNTSSGATTALMPLLVGYQFILIRGALMPAVGGLLFLLVVARMCFKKGAKPPEDAFTADATAAGPSADLQRAFAGVGESA